MGACLEDLPLIHDDDAVAVLDARQTVRDSDDRHVAGLDDLVQRVLDLLFAHVVQGTGCLVQQQDRGVAYDAARDGDPLLLPPAQLRAPEAHICVVAVGQPQDRGVDVGALGSRAHFGVRGVRRAVFNVGRDGVVEEHWLLRHNPDVAAPGVEVQVWQVMAFNADLPLIGVVIPHQERDDSAFPAARVAQQCHPLSGGKVQIQALEDLHISARGITKRDVLKRPLAGDLLQPDALLALVVDRGDTVNELVHSIGCEDSG
eukprot:CAMPEP_0174314488 /NCGR_PEP_ID=MMETSP0810-20121108/5672_1 /TAXON_ID=73025 ORGANISM="Eutreptiella gymnastica-like, Strain CCMP1594" /NCGR_SAMPLE_ID=MMETSP0810 /ASSEMBLY_ACC=CAM_ASM_000659 /LENGTH=258 /DNA_ID=CAMNT_0015423595 /DNA_START=3686 /DNA_END=4458 /DNA_ORIENTATION=-